LKPVRDFHLKRVISLFWNADVMDDRLDQLIAFATTHNWASADPHDFGDFHEASKHGGRDRRPNQDENTLGRRHKRHVSALKTGRRGFEDALERLR
jgi:hypothetical protein